MELSFESFTEKCQITLKGMLRHTTNLGTDIFGNIMRLDILLGGMEKRLIACRAQLENVNVQLASAALHQFHLGISLSQLLPLRFGVPFLFVNVLFSQSIPSLFVKYINTLLGR